MSNHPPDLLIRPLTVDSDVSLQCDVCLIGSGAGGSVVADELAESGYDVVVLETGEYYTADNFDQIEVSMMRRFFANQGLSTTRDLGVIILEASGVGGGTVVNWNTCLKPPDWLLESWEEKHGVTGLTGKEFAGYVREVWERLMASTRESTLNRNNQVLRDGSVALGYRQGNDFDIVARNTVGCEDRCDYCMYGCVYSAKQSTILNYLPSAYRNGARFLFRTRAIEIAHNGMEATTIRAIANSNGRTFSVRITPKVVVAAGGSIQTPALLLRSRIPNEQIGRNFHIHPVAAVAALYDEKVEMWKGPPQTCMVNRFSNLDGNHYGFLIEAVPGHPGLAALALPWQGGRQHKELMKRYAYTAASIVLTRDRSSGTVRINRQGEPVIDYWPGKTEIEHLRIGMVETARIHKAAGAKEILTLHSNPCHLKSNGAGISESDFSTFAQEVSKRAIKPNTIPIFTAHLEGTCRMGKSPKTSVLNHEGRSHEIRNLFVADASVFPTATGVNPMITIMSMARRTAEFVKDAIR